MQREDAGDQRTRTVSAPTLLRLGVTDTLELRLESDTRMRTRDTNLATQATVYENGYADIAVGLKWQMRKADPEQGTPGIGWVLQAELPSGSRAFRDRGVRPAILGALQWELPGDTELSLNAGAKYDNDDTAGRFVSGTLGAGVSKGFTDRMSVAVEIVAEDIRRRKYGGTVVIADVAVMYLLTPSLQLDALVGHGLTSDAPKYVFTVGVSARF